MVGVLGAFGLGACTATPGNPDVEQHCHVYGWGWYDFERNGLTGEFVWHWHDSDTKEWYCHSHPNFGEHWHQDQDDFCQATRPDPTWHKCYRDHYVP
jgi:hypothetical protein